MENMAGNMMAGNLMAPTAPIRGPAFAADRKVYLDAQSWLSSLPVEWQSPSRTWRALAPLAPVSAADADDAENRLRRILFDPVYQLM